MKYTLSYSNPTTHYLDIEVELELKGEDFVEFQLPAWRPGRYELGNFAKNIQKWQAYDEHEELLTHRKISKDLWRVNCKGSKRVKVRYNYFSFELNAGSTYLDEEQLYVNPVNCCLYAKGRENEKCELFLDIPSYYDLATSLRKKTKFHLIAKSFDELADSPFIASASLKKLIYEVSGTKFYIWFQGMIKGDFKKLVKDFTAFTKEQGKLFKGFPFKQYHFLFQILPQKAYHGVEHENSTVIALGPSYEVLDKKKLYDELLGVSSHELFHAWNVKRIRPAEMWPYDFSQENYSRLGYLAEGATTWYGDLMLYRSKVFDDVSFLKTFSQLMNRHFNNPGVQNLSVADSSYDTWLDGYGRGVPNRKSSIYTEGALITFLLDVEIRKGSKGAHSFDDVLRHFLEEFYYQGKGIEEMDYQKTVEKFAGKKMTSFFEKYVNGAESFDAPLKKALSYLGFELQKKARDQYHESYLGFVCDLDERIIMIYPGSVAELAGLSIEDQIISVNGIRVKNDLSDWCKFFSDTEITLVVKDKYGTMNELSLEVSKSIYFASYEVVKKNKPTIEQEVAFKAWFNS